MKDVLKWGWGLAFLMVSGVVTAAVKYIDIWEFQVEGNSLLSEEVIQQNLMPYLGAARTIEDVETAAQTLQKLYKQAGYPAVFVEIPPQTVVNGVFTLKVTETRVRRVNIQGAHYFLPSLIKQTLPTLEPGRPLNLSELQQDIQQANALSRDLTLLPMLKQGPSEDLIDVEVDIDDQLPLSGGIELNNFNTENTTDTRLSVDLAYSNLWQKFHEWSFQAQVSPEDRDEVQVLASTYIFPLGFSGKKVALYAVWSDSDLATLGNTRVVGEGFILGGRYIRPFRQQGAAMSTLIFGLDYKDFDESIVVAGASESYETPLDYIIFSSQFSRFQRQDNWSDSLALALKFGVRGVANDNEEFNEKRSRGEPNFVVLKADFDRTQFFGGGWSLDGFGTLQWADSPLVSNEQMSAGGVDSVRGYYESQVSADMGAIVGLQLNPPAKSWSWGKLNLLAFLEGAYLLNEDTGQEEEDEFDLAAVGVGARGEAGSGWSLDLDIGYPLVAVESIDEGEVRTSASIRYEF